MRMIRGLILGAIVLSSGLVSTLGCDSIDAAFDCHDVCNRYKDCYDPNFDTGACMSNCRTKAANNPSIKDEADRCDACIGDKSCLSATFQCGGSCGDVIAASTN